MLALKSQLKESLISHDDHYVRVQDKPKSRAWLPSFLGEKAAQPFGSCIVRLTLLAGICMLAVSYLVADSLRQPDFEVPAYADSVSMAAVGGPDSAIEMKKSKSSSSSSGGDKFGIGSFFLGCFLIPFSLTLLWKNERKLVMFKKVVSQGREDVKSVDSEEADSSNEKALVHITGDTVNETELVDQGFGIVAENSYRLKRVVEMRQWTETRHEKED